MSIHLVIDARSVMPVGTGVGNSAFRQIQGIERLLASDNNSGKWRVTIIRHGPSLLDPVFRQRWESFRHLHCIDTDTDSTRHPAADFWQQVHLPKLLREIEADVIYSPAFIGPLRTPGVARLLMIHDDMVWSQPGSYPAKFRHYLGTMTRLSARTAHGIVFPTEDARQRCRQWLRIKKKPTTVIHHGIDVARYSHPHVTPSEKPTVLCIASSERRKNQETLVRALKGRSDVRLMLLGFSDRSGERTRELRRIDSSLDIQIVPTAAESEVARHLASADVLALPTLGEGFGLPVIEAMAAGIPLVLSDIPVLREVAGDTASYIQASDIAGWRAALDSAIGKSDEVKRQLAAGAERIQKFTLEENARQLLLQARKAARRAKGKAVAEQGSKDS